jgi:brefeldin A-inhibited guanine nucleotide-exchange protein
LSSDVQRSVQALVMRIFETKLGTERVGLMPAASPGGVGVGSPAMGRTPRR